MGVHFEAQRWRHLAHRGERPCILLEYGAPWNDYGFQTRFSVYFAAAPNKPAKLLGVIKVLQRGSKKTVVPEQFAALDESFCSLGQDLEFYRRVRALGADVARQILTGLRDVVIDPATAAAFRTKPGFRMSLLRSSEAEKAFREAGRLFSLPTADRQPFTFTFSRKLPGFVAPHDVDFEFGAQPAGLGRAMALVGPNGSGKTLLLAELAYALSGLEEKGLRALKPARPSLSRIIAVSYSAFDTFRRPRHVLGVSYVYCGLRTPRAHTEEDWATAEFGENLERIKAAGRWTRWMSSLESSGVFTETPPLSSRGVRSVAAQRKWISSLSSGHKLTLLVLSDLVRQLRPNSMVLFDEPELHLHPQLLSRMLRCLHALLDEFDSYAVLATHSPIVLQEVPARAIRIIEREGNHPVVARYPLESFGENLTEIVKNAFRVDERSKNYVRVLEELSRSRPSEEVAALFENALSLNARLALRALKPSDEPGEER